MTSDELRNHLSETWYRAQSADDAHDAIWGEQFDGYTINITEILKIIEDSKTYEDAVDNIEALCKQRLGNFL
jgi:hypothetical protein